MSTVKHGKLRAERGITFYKMRKARNLYDNPGADVSEVENAGQEQQHDPSHEAEVAIETLNSGLQAVGETPLKKKRLEETYSKDNILKVTSVVKEIRYVSASENEEGDNSSNWVPGWRLFHTILLVFSS
jgi:hypothetical protein